MCSETHVGLSEEGLSKTIGNIVGLLKRLNIYSTVWLLAAFSS